MKKRERLTSFKLRAEKGARFVKMPPDVDVTYLHWCPVKHRIMLTGTISVDEDRDFKQLYPHEPRLYFVAGPGDVLPSKEEAATLSTDYPPRLLGGVHNARGEVLEVWEFHAEKEGKVYRDGRWTKPTRKWDRGLTNMVVDRLWWSIGTMTHATGIGMLYDVTTGRSCINGLLARACGVPKLRLDGYTEMAELQEWVADPDGVREFIDSPNWDCLPRAARGTAPRAYGDSGEFFDACQEVNDAAGLMMHEREEKLIKLYSGIGIRLEFTGELGVPDEETSL
jgi:hypothetical protein